MADTADTAKHTGRKFGLVALGEIDGEIVVVAPYTEGRVVLGEATLHIAKGSEKYGNRWQDASAEFHEETGIDIAALSEPFPAGSPSVIARYEAPGTLIRGSSGRQEWLMLDVAILRDIAALGPQLKGSAVLIPAEEQARALGLPEFESHLARLRELTDIPAWVRTPEDFRRYAQPVEGRLRQELRAPLTQLRGELEARYPQWIGDHAPLKFDDQRRSLAYFQKGACILPLTRFVAEVLAFARGEGEEAAGYFGTMLGRGGLDGQLDAMLNAIRYVTATASTPEVRALLQKIDWQAIQDIGFDHKISKLAFLTDPSPFNGLEAA